MMIPTVSPASAPQWITNLSHRGSFETIEPTQRNEVACMALAIYFEARGEPTRGQQAVGNVLMNRVRSGRYPNSVCGVLFQKGQFSFLRGARPAVPKTIALWENTIKMAATAVSGHLEDVSHGATSFCQKRLRRNGFQIGNHTFY